MAAAGFAVAVAAFVGSLVNLLLMRRRLGMWPFGRRQTIAEEELEELRRLTALRKPWAPDDWES